MVQYGGSGGGQQQQAPPMNPPAIVQPVDPGIAAWTLGVVVKGLAKYLEDNQIHKQFPQLCVISLYSFYKVFSFTNFIDITSSRGNGGGQQEQAPPPAVVQPVHPGTVSWAMGVVVKGLEKHLGTLLKAKDIQLHHQAFQWFAFCSQTFERCFSCQGFPKFTLTHLIDITSIGGNGGGQQQEAPNPPAVPPDNPGILV